jgi:1-acyl-sn-glycerol-3-phosphate acyltransferase
MMSVLLTLEHHSEATGAATSSGKGERESITPFYRFVVYVSRPIVRRVYRLRVRGLENVPASGGCVVAANHVSNVDPWPLGIAIWPRQLHFMAKQELWQPGLRTLLRWAGAFPVRRGEGDTEAFRTAVRLCQGGRALAMFPEGTRRAKGLRKKHQPKVHDGTARIARAAGVPLVPAAVWGTERLSRLGQIRVAFGPPIAVDDRGGVSSKVAAHEATVRLWAEIQRLEAELEAEAEAEQAGRAA